MRRFGRLFLCIAVLAVASPAFAQQAPDVVIREIYSTYGNAGLGTSPTDPQMRPLFSARVRALLDEEDGRIRRDGIGRLDFDVFVDGQDFDVSDVMVGTPQISGNKAVVEVSLLNFGEPRRFRFLFVEEASAWRIDDIVAVRTDAPWKLTALLAGE